MEQLLAPKDVAALLALSARSAARLMAAGAITSCRVGLGERCLRTTIEHLRAYQARQFAKAT